MAETPRTVITDALVKLGAYEYTQPPVPEELAWMLRVLNLILDSWVAQYGYFAYSRVPWRFTLTPGRSAYTMGPTSTDFAMPRPEGAQPGKGILEAWTVVGAGESEVRYPIGIYTPEEFQAITIPNIPATYPWALVNDGAWPLSNITFYGVPQNAYDVLFLVPNQVGQFATLDDDFDLPPNWRRALTTAVAVSGASGIRRDAKMVSVPREVTDEHEESLRWLGSINSAPAAIIAPLPGSGNNPGLANDLTGFRSGMRFVGGGWFR